MAGEEEVGTYCCDGFARRLGYRLDCPEEPAPSPQIAHLVRARWVIVFILFLYALYAGIFYSLSRFGFFLTEQQTSFLFLTLCVVVVYNLAYQNGSSLARFRYADHLQVLLDLLLVTVLIHFSGGAVSWVWTLYLVVTMEAVYLLERPRDLLLAWGAGSLFYGTLLACERAGILRTIQMPFVDPVVCNDHVFLMLIWCWVTILNAALSVIGFHLMSVSRGETLQLKESRERLFAFLEHANDLIQLNAADGSFIYANRAWLKTMGYQRGELGRLSLQQILHQDSQSPVGEQFRQVLAAGEIGKLDGVYLAKDGRLISVEGHLSCSFRDNAPDAVWGICRDVTTKREADQQLYRMAHHDPLTGLPNRQLFMDRLRQLRGMMNRMGRQVAVFYLDLDHFKSVNDTYGHPFGDKLLQEVALRLAGCVRETDTVARFGGDEFVIALGNLKNRHGAEVVARKVLKALREPYLIDSRRLSITSSIGISLYPEHGGELDELVDLADRALYQAKEEGRSCYRIFGEPTLRLQSLPPKGEAQARYILK